jgi:hypothetical protein
MASETNSAYGAVSSQVRSALCVHNGTGLVKELPHQEQLQARVAADLERT